LPQGRGKIPGTDAGDTSKILGDCFSKSSICDSCHSLPEGAQASSWLQATRCVIRLIRESST
jgi:hypothetical protein